MNEIGMDNGMDKGMDNSFDKLRNTMDGLVHFVIEDYHNNRNIDKVNQIEQPDKEIIVDIIYKLLKVVYPGYYFDKSFKSYNIEHYISALLEDVAFHLTRQIAIALRFSQTYENTSKNERRERAQEITADFLRRIPGVRAFLDLDLQAAYDGDPAAYSIDEVVLAYPGIFAITINRLAHELFLMKVPLIPRIMTEHAHGLTGIDIHPGATIGKYFFIDHGTGIVIGETTEIGDNVKIYQGVTLGALSTRGGQKLRSKKRHPTIEDNVTIYAGASILGGETVIGRNSVIGSNVFITSSLAPNTRVSVKNQELSYKSSSARELFGEQHEQNEAE